MRVFFANCAVNSMGIELMSYIFVLFCSELLSLYNIIGNRAFSILFNVHKVVIYCMGIYFLLKLVLVLVKFYSYNVFL